MPRHSTPQVKRALRQTPGRAKKAGIEPPKFRGSQSWQRYADKEEGERGKSFKLNPREKRQAKKLGLNAWQAGTLGLVWVYSGIRAADLFESGIRNDLSPETRRRMVQEMVGKGILTEGESLGEQIFLAGPEATALYEKIWPGLKNPGFGRRNGPERKV
jgi:hypothetical protein